MNRNLLFGLVLSAMLTFTSNAQAVLIDGVEYDRLYSANVNGKVGLWYAMRKGYSFGVYSDVPRWTQTQITSTTFEADQLAPAEDAARFSFEFMKETTAASGALTATDIRLLSNSGELLLSLQLSGPGSISAVPKLGAAGDFTLTGIFTAVGGDWFTAGIVTGSIYASINYANGIIANSKDFHANQGSFTLYSPAAGNNGGGNNGETEVPEPASVMLLGLGAAAGAIRRRRAQNN